MSSRAHVVTFLKGYLVNSDVPGFMIQFYDGPYMLTLQSAWLATVAD